MPRRLGARPPSLAGLAALALGLVLALLAGCAGIPSSGNAEVVRTVSGQSEPDTPPGPDPGQQPEQIVREFIYASALTAFDKAGESFVAAREFLTDEAQRSWKADSSSSRVVVLADNFSADPDPLHPGQVTVSGRQIGTVDPDRSYRPVDSRAYQVTIQLTKVHQQWRISDPPPDVMITSNDFSTAFRQRPVYFLDSSGRVVVPDLRYIPNSASPDLAANRLMDLLLRGPSKYLAGAARTQLGPGAALQSNVHVDKLGVGHVDLEGVDVSTPAARQSLAAQIVWTLYPAVQQIAITVNGLPLGIGTAGDDDGATGTSPPADGGTIYSLSNGTVANFSPDTVPGSAQAVSDAYYIEGGAILRLSDSQPMWGSVGTGSVQVASAALSAASGALAAVAHDEDGGEQLLVGRPFDHQPMVTALKAQSLTTPSFTRWGYAAWTVQNGAKQPEVYQVSVTSGTPTWSRVGAPELAGLGAVTALSLSPDAVRVALVADGRLYLGVISSSGDEGPAADEDDDTAPNGADRRGLQITGLTELRPDLTDVGPIAWSGSTKLLVGAKTAGSTLRTVYEVSVDGQSLDAATTAQTIGDVFGDVDAIASPNSDQQPLLISFQGRIWQLDGTLRTGEWTPPDGRNWMVGKAPFYPT